ncbi:hypothetical protein DSCO28_22160 [Desulfosarcina ovata subsp. sediminis]|uniref:SAM-dependent chlorinase/fluorinase n=1 Tax=Desulfosarcina ovata subsp. sediminis TaxID=885957 RepID=A0A5K7ZQA0_9BACT|nr:SAM-dependent chlorinase/fluorinase [Desulfosarcina ovata]BBO81650.1 hypothetical protein DSCO28_22160 [Desulfosarcina ovata subsp. sediminis]
MSLITLLTDFGLRDEYVGVMKGVVASIHPRATVVDITHGIDPQDVTHGAYVLAAAYTYFPAGSVHVAVIDPGVGGKRRILAVECGGHRFVAPDNGLLDRVLADRPAASAVYVENQRHFLKPVSRTFHGRDIFAPVAAHLAAGRGLDELGPPVDRPQLVRGIVPGSRFKGAACLEGCVVAADHFGNLLTTIHAGDIARLVGRGDRKQVMVHVGGQAIHGIASSYDSVPPLTPLAIIGSRGLLEISINGGNAQQRLGAAKRDPVRVDVHRCRTGPET